MKMKLVVVDLELLPRTRRLATFFAIGVLALGGAAIAYAGVPRTWSDGDRLTALDLNGNFAALDGRVTSVEQAPPPTITAWASYTPTVTENGLDAGGSQTTTAFWRRVGDTVEVRFVTTIASCTSFGQLNWSLPADVHLDATKTASFESVGGGLAYGPGTNNLVRTTVATAEVSGGVSRDTVALEMDGAPGGGVTCATAGSGGQYRVHFAAAVKGWNVTGP
jgi:hypothetical protein